MSMKHDLVEKILEVLYAGANLFHEALEGNVTTIPRLQLGALLAALPVSGIICPS